MTDLTMYVNIVRKAIAEARKEDTCYSWSIKAINKNSIKFNWSYLSKDECFTLTVRESDGEPYIVVENPCWSSNVCLLIGDAFWCDAKNLTGGIYKAIKAAVATAHRVF